MSTCVCLRLPMSILPTSTLSDSILNFTEVYKHQVDHMQLLPKYQIFAIIVLLIYLIPSITFVLSVTLSSTSTAQCHTLSSYHLLFFCGDHPSPSHRTLRII
ncbi:unnamed protein product [Debaryomyces tyrocola]|nr:unnamed protein product [Debaryomyces tyrocola]